MMESVAEWSKATRNGSRLLAAVGGLAAWDCKLGVALVTGASGLGLEEAEDEVLLSSMICSVPAFFDAAAAPPVDVLFLSP